MKIFAHIGKNLYYRDFFYSLWEDPKISLHLKYKYWLDEKVFDIYADKHILNQKFKMNLFLKI